MGYSIEDCTDDPAQLDETAVFLAAFTADGEGPSQMAEDQFPDHWKKRFRWWWDNNPYCGEESPRGLILRDGEGKIVGFFGFIPHDYVCDGKRVPSLIFAATYVRKESREAALGLWMRAHRLRSQFHLLDGGPIKEVQELLAKTGYDCAEPARLHFFPVRKPLDSPRSLALRFSRFLIPHRREQDASLRIVSSLDDVRAIPEQTDSQVRKHTDINSIRWYLQSGSSPRHFLGWVDEDGVLQAYIVGVVRKKKRLNVHVFTPVDACSFHPSGEALLHTLISHAASLPEGIDLPSEAEVLVLPHDRSLPGHSRFATIEARYRVFYHLPKELEGRNRECGPWEGDIFSY